MPFINTTVTITQLENIECVRNKLDSNCTVLARRKGLGSIMKKRFGMTKNLDKNNVVEPCSKDIGDVGDKKDDVKNEIDNIEIALSKQSLKDDQVVKTSPQPTLTVRE